MAVASPGELLTEIRTRGLLKDAQLADAEAWTEASPSVDDFVGRLRSADMLTEYQAGELLAGRGEALSRGGYRVRSAVGETRAGRVLLGVAADDTPVVLKEVSAAFLNPVDSVSGYAARARTAAGVPHPNLLRLLDAVNEGENVLLVQELLRGADVHRLVKETGVMAVGPACRYAADAADALAAAHAAGVVHGGLLPSSLVVAPVELGPSGGLVPSADARVRVMELGLVPRRRGWAEGTLTPEVPSAAIECTAPELLTAPQPSPASDVYSLTAVLAFMLSGRMPFEADGPIEALMDVQARDPSVLDALANLPAELLQVLRDGLAKAPAERPASMGELAGRLRPFVDSPLGPVELAEIPDYIPAEAVETADEFVDAEAVGGDEFFTAEAVDEGDIAEAEPVVDLAAGDIEDDQYDPFGSPVEGGDPAEQTHVGRPATRRRAAAPSKNKKWMWIGLGLTLHLTATGLILYLIFGE